MCFEYNSSRWLNVLFAQTIGFETLVDDVRRHLDSPVLTSVLESLVNSWQLLANGKAGNIHASQKWAEMVLQYSWEQLHTGHWEDVSLTWRKLYAVASLLKAACLTKNGKLQEALIQIDKGILLGAPVLNKALHSFAEVLTTDLQSSSSDNVRSKTVTCEHSPPQSPRSYLVHTASLHYTGQNKVTSETQKIGKVTFRNYTPCQNTQGEPSSICCANEQSSDTKLPLSYDTPLIDLQRRISLLNCPPLESFYKDHMCTSTPVVLTGVMDHWPSYATKKWSLDYFKKVAGPRTVPVEVGSRYTDEDWSQKLMTVSEFIDSYVINEETLATSKGYLAQHQLFDQVPVLLDDIAVPDYCFLTADKRGHDTNLEDAAQHLKVNIWFGPKGTISPLHYDPTHNLLSQVVGRKYVRLYNKDQTSYLYPHKEFLTNTSQVDIDHVDCEKFPEFIKAVNSECILHPGQMLYIPPECWHYVRSLDTSFSVSFWW